MIEETGLLGQAKPVQIEVKTTPSAIVDDEIVDPDSEARFDDNNDEEVMESLPEVAEPDDVPTDDWIVDDPDPPSRRYTRSRLGEPQA